jgi:TonB family protein
MFCVRKLNKPNSTGAQPTISTYCFAGETSILRMTLTGIDNGQVFPLFRAIRPQTFTFMGRALPSDLLVGVNTGLKNSMIAHLETIEAIATVDEAAFLPPGGAIPPPETSSVAPSPVALDTPAFLGGNNQPPLPAGTAISSSVSAGMLIKRIDPTYPAIALAAKISGTVILEAHIDKGGAVSNVRVASGSPLLQQAAMDAVKQWVYKPYVLNGEPVEINTTVNVVFQLPKPAGQQ